MSHPFRGSIEESEILAEVRKLREAVTEQADAARTLTAFLQAPVTARDEGDVPINALTVETTAREGLEGGFTTVDPIHLGLPAFHILKIRIVPPGDCAGGSFFEFFWNGRRVLAGLVRAYMEPQKVALPVVAMHYKLRIETATPGFLFYLWGGEPPEASRSYADGPLGAGYGHVHPHIEKRRRDPFGGPHG